MSSSAGAIAANRAMAARGAAAAREARRYESFAIEPDPSDDHARERDRWVLRGRTATGSYVVLWGCPKATATQRATALQQRSANRFGINATIEVKA